VSSDVAPPAEGTVHPTENTRTGADAEAPPVEEARATDPSATLLINDFDLSSAYECLIEGVLEAGIRIDAIGLQTHMHQGYWGEDEMIAMVDRFARYGLPLHLTETTLLSGDLMPKHIVDLNDYAPDHWPSTHEGEARQADELTRHYRSLVAHPSVESITYWGISDRGAWLGAPAGLIRADGSRKPGYDALHSLIKGEWWLPPTSYRTDSVGRIRVEGQAPLPQEGDAEGNEQDAPDPAGDQGPVPPADHHLGDAGHVGCGGGRQEPQEHCSVQRNACQRQQRERGEKRTDGNPAAVTHVAHVNHHPRAGATSRCSRAWRP